MNREKTPQIGLVIDLGEAKKRTKKKKISWAGLTRPGVGYSRRAPALSDEQGERGSERWANT